MLQEVILSLALLSFAIASDKPWPPNIAVPLRDGSSKSIQLKRAPPTLTCPENVATPCNLILTITHMLTMTLYDYTEGYRGLDGYAVNFSAEGELQFRYTSRSGVPNEKRSKEINSFLFPVIADAHLSNEAEVERRTVIAVNDQVPGPTIIVRKDQKLNVRVINKLPSESISIHWHGQHVKDAPWMDGVAHITQCPIGPFNEFTYSFTPDQVGTHWYHSHSGAQRTDGLFGALIVEDELAESGLDSERSFIDNPAEHTLTLIDWQHDSSIELFSVIQSGSRFKHPVDSSKTYNFSTIPDGSEAAPFPFLSGLINGLGWQFTPVSSSNCSFGAVTPLSVFSVSTGNKYRFRLIGAQSSYAFRFSIQDHKMTLIATDGILVKVPNDTKLDYIIIHSGERYDFLVETKNSTQSVSSDKFWIVAETLETMESLTDPSRMYNCLKGRRAYAILNYGSAITSPNQLQGLDPKESLYDPTGDRNCKNDAPCYTANCPFLNYPTEQIGQLCFTVSQFEPRARVVSSQDEPEVKNEPNAFLNFGFGGDLTVVGSSINGRHFLYPPSPPLTQLTDLKTAMSNEPSNFYDSNKCTASDSVPDDMRGKSCMQTLDVEGGSIVQLVLMNALMPDQIISEGQGHPVHLHGHHFQVLHVCHDNCFNFTSKTAVEGDRTDVIYCGNDYCDDGVMWQQTNAGDRFSASAIKKDTVIVPVNGYVVVQFEADNPGWWFLHCHIEPHQLEGMAMVIQESHDKLPGIPDGFPKCSHFPTVTAVIPVTSTKEGSTVSVVGLEAALGIVVSLTGTIVVFVVVILCIGGNRRRA